MSCDAFAATFYLTSAPNSALRPHTKEKRYSTCLIFGRLKFACCRTIYLHNILRSNVLSLTCQNLFGTHIAKVLPHVKAG